MRWLPTASTIVGLAAFAAPASAATLRGTAFLDRDGDGLFSAADEPVAGARVAFGTSVFASADAQGQFVLTVPDGAGGIVWVSVPELGRPGPAWAAVVPQGDVDVDLAVVPAAASAAASSFSFVVAADSHMDGDEPSWTPGDLALALDQALATPDPPRFFTIVGDITQANRPEDFAAVDEAFTSVSTPWVPVPGNHDWYDGGAAYRAKWGPDSYSFTTGGVRFIVWNSAMSATQVRSFVAADLAEVPESMVVVALGHIPPRREVALAMRDAGVDALFTGHWHANRVIDHEGLLEFGTQTIVMGGIDLTPGGYRVVHVDDGALGIEHHTFVEEPVVRLTWPSPDRCVAPDGPLLVSVAAGPGATRIAVTIDGSAVPVVAAGGWAWTGELSGLADGEHEVVITVDDAVGSLASVTSPLHVCASGDDSNASWRRGEWLQHQGSPTHEGRASSNLASPLATAWASPAGGHLHLGSPVVADDRVVVSVADLDDGAGGGVVALDLATGRRDWVFTTIAPVRHAPAVVAGIVVVASTTATIWGLDLETGEERWMVDLGAGFDPTETSVWAPPTVVDGLVYVGHQHRVVALDGLTGEVVWSATPENAGDTSGSCAAIAVGADDVLGVFHRNSGLSSWDRQTGALRWRLDGPTTQGINGAIVAVDDVVYVGNVAGDVTAIDRRSGQERWTTSLLEAHTWAYATAGSPAFSDGRLFVPTQWGRFVALEASTGAEIWSYQARAGQIRTAHYRGFQPGFQASPVVTGSIVWIADTSGLLVGLDVASGAVRFRLDLGVPVLGGIAVAGDRLVVTSWDGVVRVLAPATLLSTPPERAGCCSASGAPPNPLLMLLVLTMFRRRRRGGRRRRRRAAVTTRAPS